MELDKSTSHAEFEASHYGKIEHWHIAKAPSFSADMVSVAELYLCYTVNGHYPCPAVVVSMTSDENRISCWLTYEPH